MQKQILVVCVQLYPTSRRFEASCQIPALAYFRVLRVLSHLTEGNLLQYILIICSVYGKKRYSGTGIPCTFCATGDGIRSGL
jgi:hypothetical protein